MSLFLIISVVLTGCSESESENASSDQTKDGRVVVDFWTFWGSETRRPIIEKIVKDFNESQDEIFVKHTYLPWGDIWTKNLASIAAGNPADVIINDINTVSHRAKNEQAMNLTKYIEKEDNFKDSFYPELWNAVTYKDEAYAVPFNTDTRLLFYNKDAFKEAGLDPDKPPKTWKELEEYAKKLDKKNGDRYERIGFYPVWGSFGPGSWAINGDQGRNWIEDKEVLVNTEGKVEALSWVRSWRERLGDNTINEFKSQFGNKQANPFISGKVAMYADVATFYTQLRDYGKDVNFGVAPIPAKDEESKHWSMGGGFVAEVPKGADHPEEAFEFIKYLTGVEAQTYWATKNFDNVANIEASKKAAESEELSEEGKYVYQKAVDNLEVTKLTPVPVYAPDYLSMINPQIDAIMLGQTDAKKALDKAQKDVENIVEKNTK
ncbi:ABC transporter substrate-binding protein [Pseudalkalibacillus caeni]|uniref:ABC transporter substrate-binding protein n=2 Tax=Exobacillus caeni TaxID=2574798 RepID=A0A5R9F6M5_9BACL|nr:ABC transporter substrate-binding protein [Pseudalkalibacillus caeni]